MANTFPMRLDTIDAEGPVHFADFGGTGPRLVLVHGLGGSHANWLAVGPGLAAHARVVAPDLPGFGKTPAAGRSAQVPANRECLHRFLAAVGRPAILVGNSMGGLIAMMEAALHPENVSALVLVAPAQPSPPGTRIDREILLAFALYSIPLVGEWYLRHRAARLGPEGFVREVLRLLCVDPSRVPPEVRAAHVALAAERLANMPGSDRAFLEAARSLLAILRRRRSFEEMVGRITAPTLLIQGTRDRLVPFTASRALAARRQDWAFEVFEDTGHVPQLESSARFVAVVERWISGA
jgi:glycerol-3-phosphate dehydrogenase